MSDNRIKNVLDNHPLILLASVFATGFALAFAFIAWQKDYLGLVTISPTKLERYEEGVADLERTQKSLKDAIAQIEKKDDVLAEANLRLDSMSSANAILKDENKALNQQCSKDALLQLTASECKPQIDKLNADIDSLKRKLAAPNNAASIDLKRCNDSNKNLLRELSEVKKQTHSLQTQPTLGKPIPRTASTQAITPRDASAYSDVTLRIEYDSSRTTDAIAIGEAFSQYFLKTHLEARSQDPPEIAAENAAWMKGRISYGRSVPFSVALEVGRILYKRGHSEFANPTMDLDTGDDTLTVYLSSRK
jgi:myosin heavy subunit